LRPLSPQECGILVTHALPGRVRLRVKSLKFNYDLAHDLETRLSAINGVDGVEASPATGSLLISYRSRQEVAPPLGKALQTWFPRLDTESLLVEMLA
ncbi:MAG: HMA2 domain-containing protein, partial [Desulfobaccales bacterium]